MLPHILSLVLYLFLLPSLGQARVSDVFNIQPDQCVTCLTPVYNGCEAAEGPYGADPAAFAGCICASSAISRVAICTHDGGGCASTGAAVGQAAQTWCFLNDATYKAAVCGSKDGGVGYKYIPHAILRQVCDPTNPALSVAGSSSAARATSVLRPEVKPSGDPAKQSPMGDQAGKKTQKAATKAEASETKVTKAAAAVATGQKKSATEIDPTNLATDTDSTAMALVTASPPAANMTSSLPSVSPSRSSGGSATTDSNPSNSGTGSSSGSSSSGSSSSESSSSGSSSGDSGNGKKDTGSGATRNLRPGAGFAGAIIALVVPALMARVH